MMPSTSTKALAVLAWLCSKCGRQLDHAWTRGNTLRDVPRWLRETHWYDLPAVFVLGPFLVALQLIEGPRCPWCYERLTAQTPEAPGYPSSDA